MDAINRCDVGGVIEALKEGASPNTEIEGEKAIHVAIKIRKKEIVNILLNARANKEAVNKDGWTALMLASYRGYKEIVELLIGTGANKEITNKAGRTALHLAVEQGQANVVEIFIKAGNNKIETMKLAIFEGQTAIVKLMINLGAIKEAEDKNTALMLAIENGHIEILKLLYKNFASVNIGDRFEITAIRKLYDLAKKIYISLYL